MSSDAALARQARYMATRESAEAEEAQETDEESDDENEEDMELESNAYSDDEYGAEKDEHGEPLAVRSLFLVMLSMFQGYAAMVGPLQSEYKHKLGVAHGTPEYWWWNLAADFVHVGKFVARLLHNVVCGCSTPWTRVLVGMACMFVGALIPPLFVFALGNTWIGSVFLAYGLSGVGLGVFECTFLSVITPMGKLTKAWAVMGAPAGFATINILGLVLTTAGMPVVVLYWYIVACVPLGMAVFSHRAPKADQGVKQASFGKSIREWTKWLPLIVPFFIAQFVDHFVMENTTPVCFYMFNGNRVPLLGPEDNDHLMKRGLFLALLYSCILLGDMTSRRIPFSFELSRRRANYAFLGTAVACCVVGFALMSFKTASVSLIAVLLAFWGNGLIYGTTAKFIDRFIPRDHNLAAYSFWMFIGDAGAIFGGFMVDNVRTFLCDKVYENMCRP